MSFCEQGARPLRVCFPILGLACKICSTDVCPVNESMNQWIKLYFKQLTVLLTSEWELSGWARPMPRSVDVSSFHQLHALASRCEPEKPIALQLSLQCHWTVWEWTSTEEFFLNIKGSLKMWPPSWLLWIWWSFRSRGNWKILSACGAFFFFFFFFFWNHHLI